MVYLWKKDRRHTIYRDVLGGTPGRRWTSLTCILIIAHLGHTLEEYLAAIFQIMTMGLRCPDCGGPLELLSRYERHPIIDGKRQVMPVQRLQCQECGKTHAVLPDFVLPYKHYGTAEVEGVLEAADAGVAAEKISTSAEVSTVRRWCREFRRKVGGLCVRLRHIASSVFGRSVNVLPPPGPSGVLSQLRDSLRFLPEILSGGLVLGSVFQWLTVPLDLAT